MDGRSLGPETSVQSVILRSKVPPVDLRSVVKPLWYGVGRTPNLDCSTLSLFIYS